MANRYIDDKFISTYNLEKLKKNVTILGNTKNEQLKQLVKSLNQRNIKNSINYAIELHISGYFDNVLAKLTSVTFLSKVIAFVKLPPVTEVLLGIVTPFVALVTMLPTCMVPVTVPTVIDAPDVILPEDPETAVPSFKLKSDLALTVTL